MKKVDMNYANYKVYGKKSQSSNKNLLSDLLNEIAEAIGFNMLFLREDFSEAKGYLIDEEDIELLAEMAEKAKSSGGKRIRCKDFSLAYADTISFFMKAFLTLAKHNGIIGDELFKVKYRMLSKTDFVTMVKEINMKTEAFSEDLDWHYFLPTDLVPEEDDQMTKSDKYVFLNFLKDHIGTDKKVVRGIYMTFKEDRQAKENQKMVDFLHSMQSDEKHEYLEKIKHQALFEHKLQQDKEYAETLSEFARIECGGGKLQERKQIIPLAKKLVNIMDRNADGYMSTEEYAYGEPDFKKPRPVDDTIMQDLDESRNLLDKSIEFYASMRAYRKNHPVTEDDETMLEYFYRMRFDENMF